MACTAFQKRRHNHYLTEITLLLLRSIFIDSVYAKIQNQNQAYKNNQKPPYKQTNAKNTNPTNKKR